MPAAVIVDCGPLLAFLDPGEVHHHAVAAAMADVPLPMLTVESVLSELAFLLQRNGRRMSRANWVVESGMVEIVPVFPEYAADVAALMERYDNVPMSLADACLVKLAELYPAASLLTLDSDFSIYRRHGREPLPLFRLARGVQETAANYDVALSPTLSTSTQTT